MKNGSFLGFQSNQRDPYLPINTNDATAITTDIVTGKTGYVAQALVTGNTTMVNTYDAYAMPEDILTGKTAYAMGQKITGTKVAKKMVSGTGVISANSTSVSISGLGFTPKWLMGYVTFYDGLYTSHYGFMRDDYSSGGFMTFMRYSPSLQSWDLMAAYPYPTAGGGDISSYIGFSSGAFNIYFYYTSPSTNTNFNYLVME